MALRFLRLVYAPSRYSVGRRSGRRLHSALRPLGFLRSTSAFGLRSAPESGLRAPFRPAAYALTNSVNRDSAAPSRKNRAKRTKSELRCAKRPESLYDLHHIWCVRNYNYLQGTTHTSVAEGAWPFHLDCYFYQISDGWTLGYYRGKRGSNEDLFGHIRLIIGCRAVPGTRNCHE